jgi:hypothetical protein
MGYAAQQMTGNSRQRSPVPDVRWTRRGAFYSSMPSARCAGTAGEAPDRKPEERMASRASVARWASVGTTDRSGAADSPLVRVVSGHKWTDHSQRRPDRFEYRSRSRESASAHRSADTRPRETAIARVGSNRAPKNPPRPGLRTLLGRVSGTGPALCAIFGADPWE